MRAPKTWFSTGLRADKRLLRARLGDLFTGPRRRGGPVLLASVLLTACLGALVSCSTRSGVSRGQSRDGQLHPSPCWLLPEKYAINSKGLRGSIFKILCLEKYFILP